MYLGKISYYGWMLCLAGWLLAGCSGENMPEESESGERVLEFGVRSQDLTTRTVLSGPDAVQHVTRVHLYIFDGVSGTARCVASEEVDWPHWEGADGGLPTRDRKHVLRYKDFMPGKEYTFLAIGLDNTRPSAEDIREDHSGATYQLPQSISVGSTLKEANAVLAPGKGRQDIAGSELFAGSLPLRLEDFVKGRPVIDLYRRVAGVMGYFVNIPATIEGRKVGALQVRLYTGQNTRVPLRKVPYNGSLFSDYITSPMASDAGGAVLVEIPASEFAGSPSVVNSRGSYVLPAAAATGRETTLSLVLVDEAGGELQRNKVRLVSSAAPSGSGRIAPRGETDGGTGIIEGDDTIDPDQEKAYHYPIVANQFYSIGSKDSPIDLSDAKRVIVTINPIWDKNHELIF